MRNEDLGEVIIKWSIWRLLSGQMISGSMVYLVVAVKEIKSG